jgi:hypothetical protein
MKSPDMVLAELMEGVTLQPMPRLSLAECEAGLARLLVEVGQVSALARALNDDESSDDRS